jgi:hypothetical protein
MDAIFTLNTVLAPARLCNACSGTVCVKDKGKSGPFKLDASHGTRQRASLTVYAIVIGHADDVVVVPAGGG